MSTSLNLPLRVMPADASRIDAVQASGERLISGGSLLWRFLSAIGEARGRRAMRELARSTASSRPELSDALRRAGQGNWS